jgi:sulfur relay (sulfurtransferase) DsrC/TusE family protein
MSSTFQLARDAAEWAQSFSREDRHLFDFTYDDILPVSGTHRKLIQQALRKIKSSQLQDSGADTMSSILEQQQRQSDTNISNMDDQLKTITTEKDTYLKQLQLLDAQISDWEDKQAEETLRGDQFYMLLDEQSNIAQFVNSFITKINAYCTSPSLVLTLDVASAQATTAADNMRTSHEEQSVDKSISTSVATTNGPCSTQQLSGPDSVDSGGGLITTEDALIDDYITILSDIEQLISAREHITTITTKTAINTITTEERGSRYEDDDWSNTQLLERMEMKMSNKKALEACVKKEEVL